MEQLRTKMRQQAIYYIRGQAIGLVVAAVLALLFSGIHASLSLLAGGAICILANWACMLQMFKSRGAVPAGVALSGFFSGQVLKIGITLTLFVLCIKFLSIDFVSFMIGYCIAQISLWLTPLVMAKLKKKQMTLLCEVAQ